MAIIKKRSLKEMNDPDIVKRLGELKLELAKEKTQIAVGGSPSNVGKVKQMKRTIAKLINENKLRGGSTPA